MINDIANLFGVISILAIFIGFIFRIIVRKKLEALLVIGGAVVGSFNAYVKIASWCNQMNHKGTWKKISRSNFL